MFFFHELLFVQSEDMELLLRSSITCNASKSFTCAQSISKVKIHTDIDVYIFVPALAVYLR